MAGPIAAKAAERINGRAPGTDRGWSRASAFEQMQDAFATAAGGTGVVERTYRIAGLTVRASFAGPALIPVIEPSLAHLLATPAVDVALHVRLWDTASTGVPVPRPRSGRFGPPAMEHKVTRQPVRSSYHAVPRILSLYDPDRRSAVLWVPDGRSVPANEVASPMRTLLHWWARDNGLQFVHAAAVAVGGRAVLLAGPSGSGKSTCALAGLLSGLDYLGDDYVLVEARGRARVHSLYSAAKLQPDQVAAFPRLQPTLSNADRLASEKALWFIQRAFPERTIAGAEAVAVLVPRVTGFVSSSVAPIARSTALTALAPSTVVQLSGADQWSLRTMAEFLEKLPTYQLRAGSNLDGLARTLRRVLESPGAP